MVFGLFVSVRTMINVPPQDDFVILGTTIVLQCGVISDPSVTVHWSWFHNEQMIQTESDPRREILEHGGLQIHSVRNDDIGTYRCQVVSTGGNDTAQAHITVIGMYHCCRYVPLLHVCTTVIGMYHCYRYVALLQICILL